jgi:hypothetical protein
MFIIFQNLGGKLEFFFFKTPQVQVAANHTYESQWIKVGGVLETF